ncbi:MAG TPA: glycosyltransferase family 4 protein [Candidatus Limnocylindrales bacterium]
MVDRSPTIRRRPAWSTPCSSGPCASHLVPEDEGSVDLRLTAPRREPRKAHHDGSPAIATTAFVSTYAPVLCGIATFTADLASSVGDREIVALDPSVPSGPNPPEVRYRIRRDVRDDYLRVARVLDARRLSVISVQHEYGIWGGSDGAYVLDFVGSLSTPVVATLHTVLRNPTASQRRILRELIDLTASTVVMSNAAVELLTRSYGVRPERLQVIPHGVPDLPLVVPDSVKPLLGLAGRTVILSFGLLGTGKGYEAAIAAMPAVVAADPSALYVIVGTTHPEMLRREGEAYRGRLVALADSLGMAEHVRFVGRFVDAAELVQWLEAADIFVTPYPNLEQIVSGTLSYAMSAGKAVVSTPYAYASERLAHGRGRLVAPGSVDALAEALAELVLDPGLRAVYGRRAYDHSRGLLWPEVGAAYRGLFERVARSTRTLASRPHLVMSGTSPDA